MTYGLERSDLLSCSVINGYTTVCVAYLLVGHLWHALVAAVASSEVNCGRPVVGEVLGKGACSAASQVRNVGRCHACVEGILDSERGTVRRRRHIGRW